MIQRIILSTLLFGWLVMSVATAQEDTTTNEPADVEQESSGEVKIRSKSDDGVISEFRINGQLYMIRVTPKKGLPYYLVDSDGDGNLETRWNELAPELLIPAWVLKRW